MDELLSWLRYPHELTSWKMLSVILFNDKQRYTLRLGLRRRLGKDVPTLFIQAKQGHGQTIPVEPSQLLQEELSYWNTARLKPVVHGTVLANWSGIKAEGLIPGYGGTNRSANHFMATGMLFRGKHTNLSNVNPWSTLFIELDLDEWLKRGNKAYLSKNGVVNIYEKVPKEYFKLVVKGKHNMPLRSQNSLISWWDVLWPVMCDAHVPSFNQIAKAYGNVPSPPTTAPSSSSKVEEMPTTPALKKLQEEATEVLKKQKEEKKKQKDKGKKEQAPSSSFAKNQVYRDHKEAQQSNPWSRWKGPRESPSPVSGDQDEEESTAANVAEDTEEQAVAASVAETAEDMTAETPEAEEPQPFLHPARIMKDDEPRLKWIKLTKGDLWEKDLVIALRQFALERVTTPEEWRQWTQCHVLWAFVERLMNPFGLNRQAHYDEFNDCIPQVVSWSDLPAFFRALVRYQRPDINEARDWQERYPRAGYQDLMWYYAVWMGKTYYVTGSGPTSYIQKHIYELISKLFGEENDVGAKWFSAVVHWVVYFLESYEDQIKDKTNLYKWFMYITPAMNAAIRPSQTLCDTLGPNPRYDNTDPEQFTWRPRVFFKMSDSYMLDSTRPVAWIFPNVPVFALPTFDIDWRDERYPEDHPNGKWKVISSPTPKMNPDIIFHLEAGKILKRRQEKEAREHPTDTGDDTMKTGAASAAEPVMPEGTEAASAACESSMAEEEPSTVPKNIPAEEGIETEPAHEPEPAAGLPGRIDSHQLPKTDEEEKLGLKNLNLERGEFSQPSGRHHDPEGPDAQDARNQDELAGDGAVSLSSEGVLSDYDSDADEADQATSPSPARLDHGHDETSRKDDTEVINLIEDEGEEDQDKINHPSEKERTLDHAPDNKLFPFDIYELRRSPKDIGSLPRKCADAHEMSLLQALHEAAYQGTSGQPSQFMDNDSRNRSKPEAGKMPFAHDLPDSDDKSDPATMGIRKELLGHKPPKDQGNYTSRGITTLTVNFGNLTRKSKYRGESANEPKSRAFDAKNSSFIQFLLGTSAHITMLCEAHGIQTNVSIKQSVKESKWLCQTSADENMAVLVREALGVKLTKLLDTTDPMSQGRQDYNDDPTKVGDEEKILWYMIVEVDFGMTDDQKKKPSAASAASAASSASAEKDDSAANAAEEDVKRLGMSKCRVLVFHCDNKAATSKHYVVRKRYRQMLADVAKYQVDFMGGDANASIYRSFNNQEIPCIAQSSLNHMVKTMVEFINRFSDNDILMGYQMATSNSLLELRRLSRYYGIPKHSRDPGQEPDIDCIVTYAFNWGHDDYTRKYRKTLLESAHHGTDSAKHTWQNMEENGTTDFKLDIPEYFFQIASQLGNAFWLQGAKDHDWHNPLVIHFKSMHDFTKKEDRRSGEAKARRAKQARQKWESSWKGWGQQTTGQQQYEPAWQEEEPFTPKQPERPPPPWMKTPSQSSWQQSYWLEEGSHGSEAPWNQSSQPGPPWHKRPRYDPYWSR